MLLPSMYANAAGRLIAQVPTTLVLRFPTALTRAAAGRFLIAPSPRPFSISLRSAFAAAAKVAQKPAAAKKKTAAKAASKTATVKKGTKVTTKSKTKKPGVKANTKANTKTVAASKKKKAVTAKKAASKRKTKPLTQEQKNLNDRRALRKIVLKEPHNLPDRVWPVFITEWCRDKQGGLLERLQGASEVYKSLDDAEKEKLRSTAETNRLANQAAYSAWVQGYPVEVISAANKARARLTRKYKITLRPIRDSRVPKRTRNPFSFFVSSKFQSGQASGVSAAESVKHFGREWASMPDTQKLPYVELADADSVRYKRAKKTAGL